jgi:hypothetical protein
MARAKNETREQRISLEAIVDAYDSSERAMGWYYCLDGKMKFPFRARCRLARPISVLKVKEEVPSPRHAAGRGMRHRNVFVWIRRAGEQIAVPLAQLQPLSKDQETQEAVNDWFYWVDRSYEM